MISLRGSSALRTAVLDSFEMETERKGCSGLVTLDDMGDDELAADYRGAQGDLQAQAGQLNYHFRYFFAVNIIPDICK